VEIKLPTTPLLVQQRHRPEVWHASAELSSVVAQSHVTVEKARRAIGTKLIGRDSDGFETGISAFASRPRSYLLVGSLDQFLSADGRVSDEKYLSFEHYRNSLKEPEIITYDELCLRATNLLQLDEK
jgi:Shedu protein SduA, C-terminal